MRTESRWGDVAESVYLEYQERQRRLTLKWILRLR